jgi:6-phosphogluconolactonase
MRGTLIICADYESLCHEAARRFASAAEATGRRPFRVALSGGGTPRRLYEFLASAEFQRRIPWERVHFFWGDERMVPHDHPQSNYRLARDTLLKHVRIPPKNIHPVPVSLPLAQAATEYEQELRRHFGRRWGFPEFDLILLGLGDDGHTASLFSGSPALHEKQRWVAAHQPPHLPGRITLTLPVLNAARRVFFLVSGDTKATALRVALEASGHLPAQLVHPKKGELLWLADSAAAGKLKGLRVELVPTGVEA